MPYLHEIITNNGELIMSHSRVTNLPSGLAVATEIAHTIPSAPSIEHAGDHLMVENLLYLPLDYKNVAKTEGQREIVESIECDDLVDFTRKGTERLRELASGLGRVSSFELHLAQEGRWVDRQRPSGLILPGPPEVFFKKYSALPEEIEALEEMTSKVISKIEPNSTTKDLGIGQYL